MDTGVSKQSNAGRKETMVGSSEVVVGHMRSRNALQQTSDVSAKEIRRQDSSLPSTIADRKTARYNTIPLHKHFLVAKPK